VAVARGRAGHVEFDVQIDGLNEWLRVASQVSPDFNTRLRKAAEGIAQSLVDQAQTQAAATTHWGTGRNNMFVKAASGLRARRDRIPTIKLDSNRPFRSASRSKKRGNQQRASMADVFFGAEFGGQRRSSTRQFNRHMGGGRGKGGWFFWPTVRANRQRIADEYLSAIDKVLSRLSGGPR
jgi:hypothetical protein